MKLSVLQDTTHSDEEKEKRLKQIDLETHQIIDSTASPNTIG
jgi:hypothetical protein